MREVEMGADAAWSLADLPSDARDAAQAAARKEGLTVGQWLTRRILRSFSELNPREQEQAFNELCGRVTELAQRLDAFDGRLRADPMREAVQKLHQALARMTDELVQTAGHSAIQICSLSSKVEGVSGTVDEVRAQASRTSTALEERIALLQQNLDGLESRQTGASHSLASKVESLTEKVDNVLTKASGSSTALEQHVVFLQQSLDDLDIRHGDVCHSLTGRLENITARLNQVDAATSEESAARAHSLEQLRQRNDDLDARQRDVSRLVAAKLENLNGKLDEARTEASGMCGALDQRLLLVQRGLLSLDSRQGASSHTLAQSLEVLSGRLEHVRTDSSATRAMLERHAAALQETLKSLELRQKATTQAQSNSRNREAATAGAILDLGTGIAELKERLANPVADKRVEALEQNLFELAKRAESIEQALDPQTRAVDARLKAFDDRLETDEKNQQEAIAALRTELLDETSKALDTKLEAEAGKENNALASLKSDLIVEISRRLHDGLDASVAKQREAVAELRTSLLDELSKVLDQRLEAQSRKQDAIAERTASIAAQAQTVTAPPAPAQPSSSAPAEIVASNGVPPSPTTENEQNAGRDGHQDTTVVLAPIPEPDLAAPALALGAAMDSAETASVQSDLGSTSYLSAARQSLRAAAQQSDTDTAKKTLLSFIRSSAAPAAEKGQKTSYALVAGIVLVAMLAIAIAVNQFASRPASSQDAGTTRAIRAERTTPHHARSKSQALARPLLPQAAATKTSSSVASANTDQLVQLAKSGAAHAELQLGLRYLGDGNNTEAAAWLARAASQGEALAEYRLATLYAAGRGVPADTEKAFHWYEAAAQAGNRKAMSNLAVAYAQGRGTTKDPEQAFHWFSKAAELGLVDAQFDLAILYERGLGVPQSLTDAYRWYAIAAKAGDQESKDRLDALTSQLLSKDRASAEDAAATFQPLPMNPRANDPQ